MAVLLFQLLFFGRHPYAGVPLDPKLAGDLEGAIRGDRFAYGSRRAALGVEQPPGTLPLGIYGDGVAALLERAFAPGALARPDEKDWLRQLQALQSNLTTCKADPDPSLPEPPHALPLVRSGSQDGCPVVRGEDRRRAHRHGQGGRVVACHRRNRRAAPSA